MSQAGVEIAGQKIPWTFIQMIRRNMGGDWDRTLDLFWRARKAEGDGAIIKWIVKGFKAPARYAMTVGPLYEKGIAGKRELHDWWTAEVYKAKRDPKQAGAALKELFRELAA